MIHRRGFVAAGAAVVGGMLPGAVSAGAGAAGSGKDPEEPVRSSKPNLVIVQLDDMRAEDWAYLRNTRDLLRHGAWYENYCVNFPQCAPSRATLLTGQLAHNHRVYAEGNTNAFVGYMSTRKDRISLGAVLKRAGYRTAMIGKFINDYPMDAELPSGWDRWAAVQKSAHYGGEINVDGVVETLRPSEYTTRRLTEIAEEFVAGAVPEEPLFLYFNPTEPHRPEQPERQYRSRYANSPVKRNAAFNEADVSDKPSHIAALPLLTEQQMNRYDKWRRARWRMMLTVDDVIPQLVRALDEAGRLDNTHIFVLSDNGIMIGAHRLEDKSVPYDPAVRIPMLAWGPRFRSGTKRDLVCNADIAPTCAELAGTTMPAADGVSLFSSQQRDFVVLQCEATKSGLLPGGMGLRSNDLLYFEYDSGEREYYDRRNDPLELVNLLGPSAGPTPVIPPGLPAPETLSARLATLRRCWGRRCV